MTTDILARDPFDLVAERDERIERLKQALRAMSEQQLQVLVEHELRGVALPRVARAMGVSREEAERHLTLARQRLSGLPDA
jgi:DNA-directed RNA polymerase specialized sigma24 family protein